MDRATDQAVPYTPPTVWAPPRTFQHTQPQQDQGQEAWVTVPGSRRGNWGGGNWGSGNWGRGRGVEVAVPIPLGPTPPQSQAQLTSQIVGEFSECLANGTDLILDCLQAEPQLGHHPQASGLSPIRHHPPAPGGRAGLPRRGQLVAPTGSHG